MSVPDSPQISVSSSFSSDNQNTLTGKVKWFNNKAGFGFITVCDGEHSGKDIFVHYSAIQVQNSQYKYLVQGEYVDFLLVKPDNSEHEYHAINVGGIKGGSLMCETRRQYYATRPSRPADEVSEKLMPRSRETSREEVSQEFSKKTTARRAYSARRPEKSRATPIEQLQEEDDEGFQKVSRNKSVRPKGRETSTQINAQAK